MNIHHGTLCCKTYHFACLMKILATSKECLNLCFHKSTGYFHCYTILYSVSQSNNRFPLNRFPQLKLMYKKKNPRCFDIYTFLPSAIQNQVFLIHIYNKSFNFILFFIQKEHSYFLVENCWSLIFKYCNKCSWTLEVHSFFIHAVTMEMWILCLNELA